MVLTDYMKQRMLLYHNEGSAPPSISRKLMKEGIVASRVGRVSFHLRGWGGRVSFHLRGVGGHSHPLESYMPPLEFALHTPTLHGAPPKILNRPLCPLLQKLLDETLVGITKFMKCYRDRNYCVADLCAIRSSNKTSPASKW